MLERRPVTPAPAGYPTLDAYGQARRRFLKLAALTSAGLTLGLPLGGCPGGPGSNQGGGGQGGGQGDGWVPWDGPERLAGEPMMVTEQPVAVVVTGGAIPVTFQDGVQAELVVAAVALGEATDVRAEFMRQRDAHAELVREQAARVSSAVLTDAAALEAFEAALFQALSAAVGGAYLGEVSVAEARSPEPARAPEEPARAPAPAREEAADMAREAERARESEPAREAEAPSAAQEAAAAPPRGKLAAQRLWIACRKPGCTTCGAR